MCQENLHKNSQKNILIAIIEKIDWSLNTSIFYIIGKSVEKMKK